MSKQRLEGKVAIITGAASGIGEAAARLFASHGATVVVTDIQDDLGRSVAASIPNSTYIHCDVRDEAQIAAAVAATLQNHGRLDVLFSNAGIAGASRGVLETTMQDWDNIMAINARGSAAFIKHAGRAMKERGTRGSIVCTASIAASRGVQGAPAYTASKHAVLGLARAAAAELGAYGIRVNCVSPSVVATPLACGFLLGCEVDKMEEYGTAVASLKGAALKVGDVAEAALFLASDESRFVTGLDMIVDGGRTSTCPRLPEFFRQ